MVDQFDFLPFADDSGQVFHIRAEPHLLYCQPQCAPVQWKVKVGISISFVRAILELRLGTVICILF